MSMKPKVPPAKLVVAWLTMFLVGTELFVLSPLLPILAADYQISPPAAGLSVTVFSLAYMVSAPLFGYLADRIGRRRVLICSLLAFGAANLLTASAANLPWLLAVRLFAGAAAAGISPSIYLCARGQCRSTGSPRHLAGTGCVGAIGVARARRIDWSPGRLIFLAGRPYLSFSRVSAWCLYG